MVFATNVYVFYVGVFLSLSLPLSYVSVVALVSAFLEQVGHVEFWHSALGNLLVRPGALSENSEYCSRDFALEWQSSMCVCLKSNAF